MGLRGLTERYFFKGSTRCLWEAKVDKSNFKREKAAISKKIPPTYVCQSNRVNKGREELSTARKELKNCYTTRSLSVGPDLNQVCYVPSLTLGQIMGWIVPLTVGNSIECETVGGRVCEQ